MATIRRSGAASAAVLIGLTASLLAANLIAPEWARRAGLDVWNYAALDAQRVAIAEDRAALDAKGERDARRRARADQLAVQLIDGNITLAATAVDLVELFGDDSGAKCVLEAYYPTVRDPRLLFARHAINRATRLLVSDSAQQTAVRDRLEADYRALEAAWGSKS